MGKKVQPKDTLGILEKIVEVLLNSNSGDHSQTSRSWIGKDLYLI